MLSLIPCHLSDHGFCVAIHIPVALVFLNFLLNVPLKVPMERKSLADLDPHFIKNWKETGIQKVMDMIQSYLSMTNAAIDPRKLQDLQELPHIVKLQGFQGSLVNGKAVKSKGWFFAKEVCVLKMDTFIGVCQKFVDAAATTTTESLSPHISNHQLSLLSSPANLPSLATFFGPKFRAPQNKPGYFTSYLGIHFFRFFKSKNIEIFKPHGPLVDGLIRPQSCEPVDRNAIGRDFYKLLDHNASAVPGSPLPEALFHKYSGTKTLLECFVALSDRWGLGFVGSHGRISKWNGRTIDHTEILPSTQNVIAMHRGIDLKEVETRWMNLLMDREETEGVIEIHKGLVIGATLKEGEIAVLQMKKAATSASQRKSEAVLRPFVPLDMTVESQTHMQPVTFDNRNLGLENPPPMLSALLPPVSVSSQSVTSDLYVKKKNRVSGSSGSSGSSSSVVDTTVSIDQ